MKLIGVLLVIVSAAYFFVALSVLWKKPSAERAGAIAAAVGPALGMILGAVIYKFGQRAGTRWVCSLCGNPVARDAVACPKCGAVLS